MVTLHIDTLWVLYKEAKNTRRLMTVGSLRYVAYAMSAKISQRVFSNNDVSSKFGFESFYSLSLRILATSLRHLSNDSKTDT